MKSRRPPKVSAYPVRIHCTSPPVKPSSLRTDGSAMATIVRSSTATNEAQHSSTNANVFLPALPPPSDTMLSSDANTINIIIPVSHSL
jgi:hypothetical protein